ncbi:MAG: LysR substrate-binding domain-containing protein [Pseudomonadota bacterium]
MLEPKRPKGPPLNALRAFESAARLGGFSAAAHELCVTPAAVTQQVKSLESWVGQPLFERRAQGVELNALGQSALQELGAAFDQLGLAAQNLRTRASPFEVRIAALPSVAQLWLSPRLSDIRRNHPEIKISITAMESRPNLLRESFDLCLFFSTAPLPDNSTTICADELFPVCAPEMADRIRSPNDLASVPLLQDVTFIGDWRQWITGINPHLDLELSGPTFSHYSLAVEEAKNGAGVLFGRTSLIQDVLDQGLLVEPFDQRVELSQSLIVITRHASGESKMLDSIVQSFLST